MIKLNLWSKHSALIVHISQFGGILWFPMAPCVLFWGILVTTECHDEIHKNLNL